MTNGIADGHDFYLKSNWKYCILLKNRSAKFDYLLSESMPKDMATNVKETAEKIVEEIPKLEDVKSIV